MKTLEILIPTYARPEGATRAIESCLSCLDDRFLIRCNSNGFEDKLEKYRNYDHRLVYDCFEKNRGVAENFAYLIKSSSAKYCMLLSDEDSIDKDRLHHYLDFLDSCVSDVKVISCSIFDEAENRYYYNPDNSLENVKVGITHSLLVPTVPTYMSGLTYRTKDIQSLDLCDLFKESKGNSYAHIDIMHELLVSGGFCMFYTPMLVIKGEEIKFGGDSYSHQKENDDCQNKLNPDVYGPVARARQYYYLENRAARYRRKVSSVTYFFYRLQLLHVMSSRVIESAHVSDIDQSINLYEAVILAMGESKKEKEFSGSLFSKVFHYGFLFPDPVRSLYIDIMRKIIKRQIKISRYFLCSSRWRMTVGMCCPVD